MKILIASQYPVTLKALEYVLSDLGVHVEVTDREEDLKTMAEKNDYSLIITTFTDPFLNGYDLARRLRERYGYPRPALFLIASLTSEREILGLYESGIDQFFNLPVSVSRIRRKVISQIQHSFR